MIIGVLTVKLFIPASNSLKSKRKVVKSLKERLRNKFNISVSETDYHDKWQLAVIAIAHVSTDTANVNSSLSKALNFIEDIREVDVVDHQLQLL